MPVVQRASSPLLDAVRDIGYEPVLVGPMKTMGNHLLPGTALAGERSPEDIRKIAATLK